MADPNFAMPCYYYQTCPPAYTPPPYAFYPFQPPDYSPPIPPYVYHQPQPPPYTPPAPYTCTTPTPYNFSPFVATRQFQPDGYAPQVFAESLETLKLNLDASNDIRQQSEVSSDLVSEFPQTPTHVSTIVSTAPLMFEESPERVRKVVLLPIATGEENTVGYEPWNREWDWDDESGVEIETEVEDDSESVLGGKVSFRDSGDVCDEGEENWDNSEWCELWDRSWDWDSEMEEGDEVKEKGEVDDVEDIAGHEDMGLFGSAMKVCDEMPVRDVPGKNVVLPCYSHDGQWVKVWGLIEINGYEVKYANLSSEFWVERTSPWQDVQHESLESVFHLKQFVSRESPWKVDSESTGVSAKLKQLEHELVNLERIGGNDLLKIPSYEGLVERIADLCRKMQTSDPYQPDESSEFKSHRQTEFLVDAFRLQQRASETGQKLIALQSERRNTYVGNDLDIQAKLIATRNSFREFQRKLEIWLARIIGNVEGMLSRDGATFNRLMRYAHPQVKLIDFSPGEKFLVTYSSHEPSNPRDTHRVVLNIFEVRTGKIMKDFKGSADDFAVGGNGGYFSEIIVKDYAYPRHLAMAIAQLIMAFGHLFMAMGWPGEMYVGTFVIGLGYGAHWAIVPAVQTFDPGGSI